MNKNCTRFRQSGLLRIMPVISFLASLGMPGVAPAASLTWEVFTRSQDVTTAFNPEGVWPGLITSGVLNNPDTSLNQDVRVERSISNESLGTHLEARVAVTGGRLSALASGFWGQSYSDTAEPSQAATAFIRLRDSFVISGSGAPVALDFQVALDGSIQANNANAMWQMGAFLAQGLVGSDPNNPDDYQNMIMLAASPIPEFGTVFPPYGLIDYLGGPQGDMQGGVYSSSPLDVESPTPLFQRGVPIEVFWYLRTDIDDRDTPLTSPGSASGNFYNTATWLGITARDSDGNLINDLTAVGASGYDWYVGESSVVPLPASAWLLLSGIALLGGRLRKRA
jgi:hypothetical protein